MKIDGLLGFSTLLYS